MPLTIQNHIGGCDVKTRTTRVPNIGCEIIHTRRGNGGAGVERGGCIGKR